MNRCLSRLWTKLSNVKLSKPHFNERNNKLSVFILNLREVKINVNQIKSRHRASSNSLHETPAVWPECWCLMFYSTSFFHNTPLSGPLPCPCCIWHPVQDSSAALPLRTIAVVKAYHPPLCFDDWLPIPQPQGCSTWSKRVSVLAAQYVQQAGACTVSSAANVRFSYVSFLSRKNTTEPKNGAFVRGTLLLSWHHGNQNLWRCMMSWHHWGNNNAGWCSGFYAAAGLLPMLVWLSLDSHGCRRVEN